jgi:hypothetical protein
MSHKRHTLKIFGLAVMAALAISALAVSSAPAATWKVNGASLANGQSREMTAQLKAGTAAALTGTLLGQHFQLTATGLSSAGWGGAGSATIEQVGTKAKARGRLSFSGLTVDKPAGCTVAEPIVFEDLTTEVVEHGSYENAYVKFFPEEGETLATITVKGCAVAGSYPLKGTFYGEGNIWGEEFASQPLSFSPGINVTLGGSLTLGSEPAIFTAEGENHLASGQKFGVRKPATTWQVNGTSLANGESREMTAQLKAGTTATLTGTLLGQSFELTASALSSSGWEKTVVEGSVLYHDTKSASILQSGGSAKVRGKLSFSGLTVHKPAGCTATSPIVTKPLTAEVVEHGASETAYVKFVPDTGATLAVVTLKGCVLAGGHLLQGTLYSEGNKWGEELVNQRLAFSPVINATLGGALTLDGKASTLTAETTSHLESGENFGPSR